jgi:uncharacterized membrane-anchored protein YjiN (DUF445 family)
MLTRRCRFSYTLPSLYRSSRVQLLRQHRSFTTDVDPKITPPTPPQNSTDYAIWNATQQLYHKLDNRLQYRGYSTLRILAGVVGGSVLLTWLFQKQIKGFFSEHGAEVASQSLSSSNVQTSAGDLSKAVIQQVLQDPKSSDMAVQFLTQLSQRPDTRRMVVELVVSVLNDEQTKQQVSQLAREQVAWYLLNDPQTLENVVTMFTRALMSNQTLASSNELVKKVIQDEYVQDQVAQMFAKVIVTDYVKSSAQDLGTHTIHQVLEDENVKEHTTSFVRAVLQDQHIQHDAGYALWEALKVSLTPRWFARSPTEETPTSTPPTQQILASSPNINTTTNNNENNEEANDHTCMRQ